MESSSAPHSTPPTPGYTTQLVRSHTIVQRWGFLLPSGCHTDCQCHSILCALWLKHICVFFSGRPAVSRGQPRSNVVNRSQPRSNVVNCTPGHPNA